MSRTWRWTLGIIFIIAVALIWIAASFVVQSVVDAGVSPFLITYTCNSLFVIYIPIVEFGYLFESWIQSIWNHCCIWFKPVADLRPKPSDRTLHSQCDTSCFSDTNDCIRSSLILKRDKERLASEDDCPVREPLNEGMDLDQSTVQNEIIAKHHWTRLDIAKVSLLICPFWFLAQLTFNLSLKYTTVTSNTILSSTSSLFTLLVSLVMLNETFTWMKFVSILLCMIGSITVGLGDTESDGNNLAKNPLLGDFLCIMSAIFYALYTSLIRKMLPDEEKHKVHVSTAHFLGFLGLFNMIIFFPVVLILHLTKVESFHQLTLTQFGLIIGKGLLDNVLSDYLWAKAVLLTTPTVATAGLNIQIPLAALIDSVMGSMPHLLDYIGGTAVLIGFLGISQPAAGSSSNLVQAKLEDDTSQEVNEVYHNSNEHA